MTHFQLFARFGKILLVKKILEKPKFLLVHTIAPKPILNDQVGFRPGPNEKKSGASKSTVITQ